MELLDGLLVLLLLLLILAVILLLVTLPAMAFVWFFLYLFRKSFPSFDKLPVGMQAALVGASAVIFVSLLGFVKELAIIKDNLLTSKKNAPIVEQLGKFIVTARIDERRCDWRMIKQDVVLGKEKLQVAKVFPAGNGDTSYDFPVFLLTIENNSTHQIIVKRVELVRTKHSDESISIRHGEFLSVMATFDLSLPQGNDVAGVEILPPLRINKNFAATFNLVVAPAGFISRRVDRSPRSRDSYYRVVRPLVIEGGVYRFRILYGEHETLETKIFLIGRSIDF